MNETIKWLMIQRTGGANAAWPVAAYETGRHSGGRTISRNARISRIVRLGKSKRLSDVSHVTLFPITAGMGQSQESGENNSRPATDKPLP